jgi:hypothetical protein
VDHVVGEATKPAQHFTSCCSLLRIELKKTAAGDRCRGGRR